MPEGPLGDRYHKWPEDPPSGNRPEDGGEPEDSDEDRPPSPPPSKKPKIVHSPEHPQDDILDLHPGSEISDLEDTLVESSDADEIYDMLDDVMEEGKFDENIKDRLAEKLSATWQKPLNKEKIQVKLKKTSKSLRIVNF